MTWQLQTDTHVICMIVNNYILFRGNNFAETYYTSNVSNKWERRMKSTHFSAQMHVSLHQNQPDSLLRFGQYTTHYTAQHSSTK